MEEGHGICAVGNSRKQVVDSIEGYLAEELMMQQLVLYA